MAIPDRIRLRIVSIDDARLLSEDCLLDHSRTLVIVSSIKDAHRLFEKGFTFGRLNIGNNKSGPNARQVSYSVWMDDDDLRLVHELMDHGVEITLQSVPRERGIDMKTIMDMVKT